MSDIARRPNRTPRRVREKRAFQLVVVGSAAGLVAAIGFLLALFATFPGWIVFFALVVCVACVVMFKRMTTRR